MKKLNNTIYNKLLLQAQEAKEQNRIKLASSVLEAIGSSSEDEDIIYATDQLDQDIHNGMWKLATCVLKYHDVSSADIEKLDDVISILASKFIDELETSLCINGSRVGPLEPKLPGEVK